MQDIRRLKKKLRKKEKIRVIKRTGEITRKKRMRAMILVVLLIMFGLGFRIFWIQFINGSWLKERAYTENNGVYATNTGKIV